MTTNPHLVFALESIANDPLPSTTSSLSLHSAAQILRTKDPRHGCINGTKISTCKLCAGHVLRNGKVCAGCKGTGFTMSKCGACAVGAAAALELLIKEASEGVLEREKKREEGKAEEDDSEEMKRTDE